MRVCNTPSELTTPSLPAEMSQAVRDCVMAKMDAYAHRSEKLKAFLSRSRSPSLDGGSLGPADSETAETGASSDSGVETYDDGTHNTHNLSADSGAGEPPPRERRGGMGRVLGGYS